MANRSDSFGRGPSNHRGSGPRVGSVRKNVPPAVRDDGPRGRSRYSGFAPKEQGSYSGRDSRGGKPRYGDKPSFDKKPGYGSKSSYDKKPRYGDKPSFDKKPRYGDKPFFDKKPGYGGKSSFDKKPNFGGKPSFDKKPHFGDKPSFDKKPRYGDKPSFDKKPRFDAKPSFDKKPRFDSKPSFDRKPRFDEKPVFDKKPRFDDMPPRPFDDWNDEPFYGEQPGFRPQEEADFSALDRFDDEADAEPQEEMAENVIAGRNPIREALKAGHDIEKLLVAKGDKSGSAREIIAMAKENRVVVQEVERSRLDAIYPGHQGLIAFVSAAQYSDMDDIFALAREKGEDPFIIVLDGITDPHNLGAILRTAECCGAHGVIIPRRRGVGLTPAAVKAAAGAQEYVKVVRVVNLARALGELKDQGVWVYGADMEGEDAFSASLDGPLALVIGSEGSGVSEHVLSLCDRTIALPMKGSISSLNASVAAGVLMYQVVRARSTK